MLGVVVNVSNISRSSRKLNGYFILGWALRTAAPRRAAPVGGRPRSRAFLTPFSENDVIGTYITCLLVPVNTEKVAAFCIFLQICVFVRLIKQPI